MRPVLWSLLLTIVCLPMAFVLFLLVASRFAAMDSFTSKLPSGIRSSVADVAMSKAGYDKGSGAIIDRVLRLDPDNVDAWGRRCHANTNDAIQREACNKAVALDPTAWNFEGLGSTQEHAGDFCGAENSYTSAIRYSQNDAGLLRSMARAGLHCDHAWASVAGFEVAEGLDAKSATNDTDDEDNTAADLLADREFLVIAYNRTKQSAKANAMCTKTHPDWKGCNCDLTETGVECTNASTDAKK